MDSLLTFYHQFCPPPPFLTESSLGDLSGKVYIITGGYSGIGLRLAALLYRKNATVYLAGRSEEKARRAIKELGGEHPLSKGKLAFLPLHLDDLASIEESVRWFLDRETRLHVLWNNAGVRGGPVTTTKQGHEIHIGTNCLGHFLFTHLLHPILASTAAESRKGLVRVIWLSSIGVHMQAPKGGGMNLDDKLDHQKRDEEGVSAKYVASKTGCLFLASEWARRDAEAEIVHLSVNPGVSKTPLRRHMSLLKRILLRPMLYDPNHGAYTELFAGLSTTIRLADSGRHIVPWGRFGSVRADLEAEMGVGPENQSYKFFEHCKAKTEEWC